MSDLSLTNVGNVQQANLSDQERLKRVAAQFEAQFLNILMKDSKGFMRDESDDELFGTSPALRQFQDLLHNALVEKGAGGMGIAQVLVDSLSPSTATSDASPSTNKAQSLQTNQEANGD